MNYQTLFDFEKALGDYTNAPYVVVTDGCTHAIELVMRWYRIRECSFTAFTYISIPMIVSMLGIRYQLLDEPWQGEYQFHGTNIWDSARRLTPNMYRPGQIQCLSFGNGKPLQLGKVGAILLDDEEAYLATSAMRSDGRDLRITPWIDQKKFALGFHYCPSLEDCARGLKLLSTVTPQNQTATYPDCRRAIITQLDTDLNILYNNSKVIHHP